MITSIEFFSYKNINDLKNAGELLSDNTDLHGLLQHSPKIYFEESLFLKLFKIKYIAIQFPDNDIVSYIVKYTQIYNTKSYRLTTLPYSQQHNQTHIAKILSHLYKIAEKELSITVDENEIKYPSSEYKIIGAENYYFTYDELYKKIYNSKSTRHYYNKYSKLKIIEINNNKIDNNIINIIIKIYDQWYKMHPNPDSWTKKYLINILNSPPKDLIIFLGKLEEEYIYFSLVTKSSNHFTSCFSYGLNRYQKYHSSDLICILKILEYIKYKYNINLYYYLGYTEHNKSLKLFKDKWADDKITIYKIYYKNFSQECNNLSLDQCTRSKIMEEIKFNDLTREFIEDFIAKLPREDKLKLKEYVEANPRDSSSKTFIVVKSYIYNTYFKKTPIPEKKLRFSDVLNNLLSDE